MVFNVVDNKMIPTDINNIDINIIDNVRSNANIPFAINKTLAMINNIYVNWYLSFYTPSSYDVILKL